MTLLRLVGVRPMEELLPYRTMFWGDRILERVYTLSKDVNRVLVPLVGRIVGRFVSLRLCTNIASQYCTIWS